MQIDIVTPAGAVLETQATEVIVPAILGEMGLLPGHVPIISALDIGELTVKTASQQHRFALEGGFVEMANDKINVITESAQRPAEIDLDAARASLAQAEAALKDLDGVGPAEVQSRQRDLKLAETLIHVAGDTQ